MLRNGPSRQEGADGPQRSVIADAGLQEPPLSDGEVHYLWWFIQGSIMEPDIRWRLRRAWGMCGRHAWGALSAEAAFHYGYLHGSAVLYEDLVSRALRAFRLKGAWQAQRLARRLRATVPCLICEMGLSASSRGMARAELIEEGRDTNALRAFAEETRVYWRRTVCGRCADDGGDPRCRPHLLEEASGDSGARLAEHRALVKDIFEHLRVYRQSFVWEYHGTDAVEDRAALISAVGWCSGWRPWIESISFTEQ